MYPEKKKVKGKCRRNRFIAIKSEFLFLILYSNSPAKTQRNGLPAWMESASNCVQAWRAITR